VESYKKEKPWIQLNIYSFPIKILIH